MGRPSESAFDRQALALAFKYQRDAQPRPHLDTGIALQKLNLTPYLEDLKTQPSLSLPSLLAKSWLPDIEANLQIGTIKLPACNLKTSNPCLPQIKNISPCTVSKPGFMAAKQKAD